MSVISDEPQLAHSVLKYVTFNHLKTNDKTRS